MRLRPAAAARSFAEIFDLRIQQNDLLCTYALDYNFRWQNHRQRPTVAIKILNIYVDSPPAVN
eukprot:6707497-Prymnesium_polylepis.1